MTAAPSVSPLIAELNHITRDYDFGIVPGSATVFVLDEQQGVGRLDMTLLEGVMIVVEVSNRGYMVTSCTPLYSGAAAMASASTVHRHLNQPFDSMENLLMTISPMFSERFQLALREKLQSIHRTGLSALPQSQLNISGTVPTNTNSASFSGSEQVTTGFQEWIH